MNRMLPVFVLLAGAVWAQQRASHTECTPEMKSLKGIDVAFLPMNLPYTMPVDEAAACVKVFQPKIVYPYHYRGSDLKAFESALKGQPVEVRLREWY